MNTAASLPALRLKHLCVVWIALIGAALVYCEFWEVVHGGRAVKWSASLAWSLEAWTGWILLTVVTVRFSGRLRAWIDGARRGVPRLLAMMLALSACALGCEWVVQLIVAAHGWLDAWVSIWVLAYHRAPFYLLGAAGLVAWARFSSAPGRSAYVGEAPEASDLAPAADLAPEVIVIRSRTGEIAVRVERIEALIAAENYAILCTDEGREFLHRTTLAGFAASLGSTRMVRIHRSAFVNPAHVHQRLPRNRLKLTSGRVLRVGKAFRCEAHRLEVVRLNPAVCTRPE